MSVGTRITFILRRSASVLVLASGLAAPLYPANVARAQDVAFSTQGGMGNAGPDAEPPFNSQMLARYAKVLGLDEAQLEAAQSLLEGMQAEHQAIGRKMSEKMEEVRAEFQESRDPSDLTAKIPAFMREQGMARGKLESAFVSDLQSLLTEQQAEKWPLVARSIRRERTLPMGRIAGESVDLVRLTESLSLPAETEQRVRPMLDQYEVDIDRPLVERNDLQTKARELGQAGGEELERLRDQARQARLRIKEINESYARRIVAELPPDLAARFKTEFDKRAFPEIYDPSYTSESAVAALGFDDLTAEQRTAIEAIRESYTRDAARLNEQWTRNLEEWQKTPEGYRASIMPPMRIIANGQEAASDDPTADTKKARRDLDTSALERIKSVLSDAQRERLPKRAERRRGMPGFTGARPAGATGGGPGEPVFFINQSGAGEGPPSGTAVVHQVVTDDKGNVIHENTTTTTVGPTVPTDPQGDAEEQEVEIIVPPTPPAPPAPPQ